MSVLEWLIEGSALLLIIVSIWLHYKANVIMNSIAETNRRARSFLDESRPIFETWETDLTNLSVSMETWKEKIDQNLEYSIAEHLYSAGMQVLVSLGASEMGKGEKARQTMALVGLQKIGAAIGRGIKKEIPVIEQFQQAQDGGGGVEDVIGDLLGIKIPKGILGHLKNNMGGPAQPQQQKQPEIAGRR